LGEGKQGGIRGAPPPVPPITPQHHELLAISKLNEEQQGFEVGSWHWRSRRTWGWPRDWGGG